jgi:hypothetical protein
MGKARGMTQLAQVGAMFQVKATVVDFLGDEEKYPCHFPSECL